MKNIFADLPDAIDSEVFEDIVKSETVRIERIVSHGQASPETGWYNQDQNEWVIVLSGEGCIMFDNGHEHSLQAGDYIHIPAHQRHRVVRTAADKPTIWLAVFY